MLAGLTTVQNPISCAFVQVLCDAVYILENPFIFNAFHTTSWLMLLKARSESTNIKYTGCSIIILSIRVVDARGLWPKSNFVAS